MTMPKRLRVGVIGLGVGEKHIAAYQSHPDCEVVALCDFDEARLTTARDKYPGIRWTKVADELLTDPEISLISIASYDNYHYPQIMQALNNNKHVFVEKPLCLYEQEAREIRRRLEDNPSLRLSSNLVLRTVPRFRWLRQMIADGRMGQLYYVEGDYNYGRLHKITEGWRGKIDFYSVVYGGGVHLVDLLLWLTGDRVVEVAAYGNNLSSRGSSFNYNDMVVAILRFHSGMVGKVAANFGNVSPHFHALQIYGTQATFVNGADCGLLYTSREPDKPPQKIAEPYPGQQQDRVIHSFVDSILHNTVPEVDAEAIFQTMSVCFAIEKATHQSGSVMVKYV